MSKLLKVLSAFDGKAISILSEAQAKYGEASTFLSELIELTASQEPNVSDGATWLIKANLEQGTRLTTVQTRNLIKNLEHVTTWQAQLHLCQSFDYLTIAGAQASSIADWLTPLLKHKRPFIRAWSMNAFHILADQHKKFSRQAKAALAEAEKDPAASVRARARNVSPQ